MLLLKVEMCRFKIVSKAGPPLDCSASTHFTTLEFLDHEGRNSILHILYSDWLLVLPAPNPTIHVTVVTEQTVSNPQNPQTHTQLPRTPKHYYPFLRLVLWVTPPPATQSPSSRLLT